MKQRTSILLAALAIFLAFVLRNHLYIITLVGYWCTSVDLWYYHTSPLFLAYLKRQWEHLPVTDPIPIPELAAAEFTRDRFWKITNNLKLPVIIRGALSNTTAVNEWGQEFFLRNYSDELVVVRQSLSDTDFRVVRVPMKDFWTAFDQGLNVTIFTSSSIFAARPELKQQMAAPFESDIVDRAGNGIFVGQMFVTPGGRTFLHSEIGGNLFRQLSGRKRWIMVAPEQSYLLCPFLFRGYATVKTCVQDFEPDLKNEWFKRIPRMETILEPGDIVYNPPWYWHDAISVRSNTRQASVAGRMKLHAQSISNGPVQFTGVVSDHILAKLTGKVHDYPSNNYDTELEDFIVHSWRDTCLAANRSDCYGLPIH